MNNSFLLPDLESAIDLQSYLNRAKRLDPDGMVRFRAFGAMLAVYVAPIFAGSLMDSGPTVLGLRTVDLVEPVELDAVIPLAAALDRLAKMASDAEAGTNDFKFDVPPSQRAAWAGISPPRTAWESMGTINETRLTQIARDGIAEVANAIPESVGGPIAARIRGEIWGRGIDLESKVPTGAAFAAAGLGFLTENEEVGLYHTGGWVRLSAMHGHVLARVAVKF